MRLDRTSGALHQGRPERPSRRSFIKDSSLLVAGSAVAGPLSLGSGVHAGGSDEVRIGLIGCGQRGTAHRQSGPGHAGGVTRLVAMGDVFQDRLQASLRGLKGRHPASVTVPRDRQFVGFDAYQHVLQTDVDLVILASPPGFARCISPRQCGPTSTCFWKSRSPSMRLESGAC